MRYPGIKLDEWYIDIMTAKLLDPARRSEFKVLVMPNLYGDILTDEAAQLQGGVGTAGSANIGKKYAMFEAIHGSAPRMVAEGRGKITVNVRGIEHELDAVSEDRVTLDSFTQVEIARLVQGEVVSVRERIK